jgi:hypothetical protein
MAGAKCSGRFPTPERRTTMFYIINKSGSGQVEDGPFETREDALTCAKRLGLQAFNVLDDAEMDEFENPASA